jgi:hypothetical protein
MFSHSHPLKAIPSEVISYTLKYRNLVITPHKDILPHLAVIKKGGTCGVEFFYQVNEYLKNAKVLKDEVIKDQAYPYLLEVIRNLNDNTYAVINYGGSDYYTIVETYVDENTTLPTYFKGNLFLYGGTITVIAENYILFYDNGIEYKLASDTVSTYELIKMGESLTVISEK